MNKIDKLIESLEKIKGVGYKTARKYAYDIVELSNQDKDNLINNISNTKVLNHCDTCNNIINQECNNCKNISIKLIITISPKDSEKLKEIYSNFTYFCLLTIFDPLNNKELNLSKLSNFLKSNNFETIYCLLPIDQEGSITKEEIKKINSSIKFISIGYSNSIDNTDKEVLKNLIRE
ncbi:MAG: hypothetical protein ACK5HS_00670 [Mycoplasmatales bacterium]